MSKHFVLRFEKKKKYHYIVLLEIIFMDLKFVDVDIGSCTKNIVSE